MDNEPEPFIPESLQPAQTPTPSPRKKTNWSRLLAIAIATTIAGWWVLRTAADRLDPETAFRYKGPGWDYYSWDAEFTAPLSGEKRVYDDESIARRLAEAGGDGWELVSVIASPRREYEKGFVYRFIFKRPGKLRQRREGETDYDAERYRKALEAESKAEAEAFKRQLEEIR